MENYDFKTIVNHLKENGFVYQSSEIYGGLSNTWDFGPLGSVVKKQIKNLWWREFVDKDINMHGLDSSIFLNNDVWKNSGHLDTFTDLLVDCKECKKRFKIDDLKENNDSSIFLEKKIDIKKISCPNCGKQNFTEPKNFNLMFKVNQNLSDNKEGSYIYLRPETAQGIFINFKNVLRTTRSKIPMGIAQIGKSFRNEITPGNFIFRTREFEQMEIEFFVNPKDSSFWFDAFESKYVNFLSILGIKGKSFKVVDIAKDELAHYSDKTIDFLYEFPFGWDELLGIANRTNFDLKSHEKGSGQKMEYIDPYTREKYIPNVIEPSIGVERLMLAVFCESYEVEPLENNDSRVVMNLPFDISPYQIAVLPLTNKLDAKANEVVSDLLKDTDFRITYDKSGSIGKRYRRQDSIGTNFCITVDFETLENDTITIRDRDTMEQKRVKVNEISNLLRK